MPPSASASPRSPSGGAVPVRPGPRRTAAPARVLRAVAGGCLLVALLLCAATGWGDVPPWACLALTLVLLAAHLSSQPSVPRARRWPFSLSEGVLAAALVVGPGAWIAVAAGCAVLLVGARRPQPRLKRDVDVALAVLGAAAGQAVAAALGGGVVAACAGVVVLELVGCVLTAVAVSVMSSRPVGSLLASSMPTAALHTAGSAAVGSLAGVLVLEAPVGLLGLAVPLVLLRSSYDQSTRRTAEARMLAELARGQGSEPGRSQDVQSALLVTTTARLLGGADVDLVLLAADGPVLLVGDENGVLERRRVRADVFDEPWVLRALGRPGTGCGRDRDRPYLSTVLGGPERPVGVLRARRGPHGRTFERRELRLVDVLVAQSAAWSGPHDGDGGVTAAAAPGPTSDARTASALRTLAASADRLARLAARPGDVDDVLDDLVEEVHLAQRAVASVLGARALGRAPDAVAVASGPAHERVDEPERGGRSAEWTTTGVLR